MNDIEKELEKEYNEHIRKLNIYREKSKKEYKLSDEVFDCIQWLKSQIVSFDGTPPNKEVVDFFKKNEFIYKGTAYRGVNPEEKEKNTTSWTKNGRIAADFACQKAGYLESAEVVGLDIKKAIVEMSKWSPEINNFMNTKDIKQHGIRESEVLVLDKKDISNKRIESDVCKVI